jgi:hypothetical protein
LEQHHRKKTTAHCHCLFLLKHKEEGNGSKLSLSSSSQTLKRQNTQKKQQKKTNRREGVYLQAPPLASRFCPPIFALLVLSFHFKRFLFVAMPFLPSISSS